MRPPVKVDLLATVRGRGRSLPGARPRGTLHFDVSSPPVDSPCSSLWDASQVFTRGRALIAPVHIRPSPRCQDMTLHPIGSLRPATNSALLELCCHPPLFLPAQREP